MLCSSFDRDGLWRAATLRTVSAAMFAVCSLAGEAPLCAEPPASRSSEPQSQASEASAAEGESLSLFDFVDQQIRQGWSDNEVSPSAEANDAEWLRRVYLDIVGHIPPAKEVLRFQKDRDKLKRTRSIDRLLEEADYVRNWTTIWTNLSIGRQTPRRVSRVGMQNFFHEAFANNRPWNDIIYDLISAEGHFEKNGAVNFLLAQMTNRDNAVQATAKTTRLLLGIQVQCTQCHNHPFNDWKQNQFWEINSFFQQARRIDHRRTDPKTGRMVDDYSELARREFSGPVYFEKRNGLMEVAFPRIFETTVDDTGKTNRRTELARLTVDGPEPLIASAMVNRMWGHFFGYGFTNPVDDMGPHKAPSHPELLDRLTAEFVQSGYDLKQLIRWITNSRAYQLTSEIDRKNKSDDPAAGTSPLFSRMYVKRMNAEQVFDSLKIATSDGRSVRSDWGVSDAQRRQWLQQFVTTFGTDENDESTTFDGTIPQALMMMNGPLITNAIRTDEGSLLYDVLSSRASDGRRVRRLFVTTLGRAPSRRESRRLSQLVRGRDRTAAFQDLLWALLNSNEFIMNH